MRGAHSDVWCSKGTSLMEAELFAGQGERPAPSGRALLCAANYAREIQGITASRNLPDVRNRAPVTPVSLHISDVSAQRKVRGVKRGQETILGVLSPFAPVGGHRHPSAVGTANLASSGAPLEAEGLPSDEGKERRGLCRRLAAKGGALFRERPTGKSLIYLKYFTPFANSG